MILIFIIIPTFPSIWIRYLNTQYHHYDYCLSSTFTIKENDNINFAFLVTFFRLFPWLQVYPYHEKQWTQLNLNNLWISLLSLSLSHPVHFQGITSELGGNQSINTIIIINNNNNSVMITVVILNCSAFSVNIIYHEPEGFFFRLIFRFQVIFMCKQMSPEYQQSSPWDLIIMFIYA